MTPVSTSRVVHMARGALNSLKASLASVRAAWMGAEAGETVVRPADWRDAGETRYGFEEQGWTPLFPDEARAAVEHAARMHRGTPRGEALRHLLQSPVTPLVFKNPEGNERVAVEAEGLWPIHVAPPNAGVARWLLAEMAKGPDGLSDKTLEILARTLPLDFVRFLHHLGASMVQSERFRLTPEDEARLGPFAERLLSVRTPESEPEGSVLHPLRQVRLRPNLSPGLGAAVARRMLAELVLHLAPTHLKPAEGWEFSKMGHDQPQSVRSEAIAAFMAPHPLLESPDDERVVGRARLERSVPHFERVSEFFATTIPTLLRDESLRGRPFDVEAMVDRWVEVARGQVTPRFSGSWEYESRLDLAIVLGAQACLKGSGEILEEAWTALHQSAMPAANAKADLTRGDPFGAVGINPEAELDKVQALLEEADRFIAGRRASD